MKFDRLSDMEKYIEKNGTTSLEELCRHYNVSMSTIRRDIAELIRRKQFSKVYGGVTAGDRKQDGVLNAERNPGDDQPQQVIGRLAASIVRSGMSIFLDSGSMTLRILPYITDKHNITVISHSLPALCEAAKYPSLHVIALGGAFNCTTSSFLGGSMLDELSKMSIDLVFLTAMGVTLERGLTSASYSEVEIKKSVVKWNRNLVLMVEHSHFGREALLPFCNLKDISVIITDQPLKAEYMQSGALRHLKVITPEDEEQVNAAKVMRRFQAATETADTFAKAISPV